MITREKILGQLKYHPETGQFFWKAPGKGRQMEREAGCINKGIGYRVIWLFGKLYYAHRLVWLVETGTFPNNNIDHQNQNKLDNRFRNLRDVAQSVNQKNRSTSKNNTTGVGGVLLNKRDGKFYTRISIKGKLKNLGLFNTLEAAAFKAEVAKRVYDYHENHQPSPFTDADYRNCEELKAMSIDQFVKAL